MHDTELVHFNLWSSISHGRLMDVRMALSFSLDMSLILLVVLLRLIDHAHSTISDGFPLPLLLLQLLLWRLLLPFLQLALLLLLLLLQLLPHP